MSSPDDHSVPAPIEPAATQPPSTPSEVSASSSLARTPRSSVEQSPPDTPDGRKLGALHLQPATVEDLFNIDRFTYGDYDLIDGLLIYNDRMSKSHRNSQQVKHLLYRFIQREQLNPASTRTAFIGGSVAIPTKRYLKSRPSSSNDALPCDDIEDRPTPPNGNSDYSVVRADLAIGDELSEQERSCLSPSSQKICFPLHHPPKLILETTSENEANDTELKRKLYARAKVATFAYINNQARTKRDNPAVHVGTLHDGKYEGLEVPRRGMDDVNLGPIGILKAKDCVKPGEVDKVLIRAGWEQHTKREEAEKGREEERKRRLEEEERRKQAEKKREEESRKRLEEEERRKQAEKRREEERRKRLEEEERRKQAEKRREEERRKRLEEEERRKQAEKKREEERRKRLEEEERRKQAEKRREEERRKRWEEEERRKQAEKRREEESKKRLEEEERRKKAEKKVQKEKKRRKDAKAKMKAKNARLRQAGIPVTDSSSSSSSNSGSSSSSSGSSFSPSSPPRKKRK